MTSPTVAPHAGAWIETGSIADCAMCLMVAPHAGAWIETVDRSPIAVKTASPLTQGRGLKQQICQNG